MIVTFEDACWTSDDHQWKKSLFEVLVLLAMREQHSILANSTLMLPWCQSHIPFHADYFRTRLASSQNRANSIAVTVSPTGHNTVVGEPPWCTTALAAQDLVNSPLRVVLENDVFDRMFVEATLPSFSQWCAKGWISPAMGGGAAMANDIATSLANNVSKWRTFYLFDSDRLHPSELAGGWSPPGGDSCQGHIFEIACTNLPPRRWHRLRRRSIENYLPEAVLTALKPATSSTLFGHSVGSMAHFYNVKNGLRGDGVSPPNAAQAIRAARSQGFWNSLSPQEVSALEGGFGRQVSREFQNVPPTHAWSADILTEMDALAEALQDAI